jgi:RimJ/RimL family protein N-acetyltransferase
VQEVKLLKAEIEDIPEIRDLAILVWNQHYPALISRQQIDYMLNMMYSAESLKAQMETGHTFYLISSGGKNIGFLSVNILQEKDWFLNKFYIDQNNSAKGVGTDAFQKLVELIQPQSIRLTVNRHNVKSINFYFKNGFIIDKIADFDIGNGYVMNDFVMMWRAEKNHKTEALK